MVREPNSFQGFVEDQLTGLGRIEIRRMFGGAGVYKDGVFFGILHKDRLYFRTDAASRAEYLARGMGPFAPSPETPFKNYHEVPVEIVEDAEALAAWARRAVACQEREGKPRPRKASAKRAPKAKPNSSAKPGAKARAKRSRARGR